MSISIRTFVAFGAILAMSIPAFGVDTAPGQDKLLCFDGTTDGGFGGVCTLNSNGAKGPATLNNTDSNPAGDYAGVYIQSTTLSGQLLTSVKQLGYQYSGTTTPTPGDLSLNLPIDTDGNHVNDFYAFIDAFYCPGVGGKVDVIHDANCGIYAGGVLFYPNWAAFVAAYPGATIATTALPFVIAERTSAEGPALWTVKDVTLGKPGK
jgi:hypothetical protein